LIQLVLAIETSCDDTSVAIVRHDGQVLSCISANQDLAHAPFGGIVPEIACRNHTFHLLPLVQQALQKASLTMKDLQGIVVTARPGLLGSLLVGVTVAKTLSQIHKLPLLGVNHLEGHLYAPFLKDQNFDLKRNYLEPFIGLCVSGGHTSLIKASAFGKYKVASGVYMVFVSAADGAETTVKKIMIVR
jgi:N6-L-threonylcarbamoyladenine synthase